MSGSKLGFPNLSKIDFELDNSFPVTRGCRMHCTMFSSILGVYPFDASNTHIQTHTYIYTHTPLPHQIVRTKNISSHCQMSLGRQNSPGLRTIGLNGKRTLPAITKNLFFFNPGNLSVWLTISCHKWPIYELLAPDYNILSSSPQFPQTTHKCPRHAISACQDRDYPVPFTLSPVQSSMSPWTLMRQRMAWRYRSRKKQIYQFCK